MHQSWRSARRKIASAFNDSFVSKKGQNARRASQACVLSQCAGHMHVRSIDLNGSIAVFSGLAEIGRAGHLVSLVLCHVVLFLLCTHGPEHSWSRISNTFISGQHPSLARQTSNVYMVHTLLSLCSIASL